MSEYVLDMIVCVSLVTPETLRRFTFLWWSGDMGECVSLLAIALAPVIMPCVSFCVLFNLVVTCLREVLYLLFLFGGWCHGT